MQNEKNRSQKQIWRFRSGLVVALFYFFILSVSHLLCPGLRCCTFWFILLRRNLMQGQFARRRRFLRRARACCWQKNNPANVIPDPFFSLPRRSTEFNVRPEVWWLGIKLHVASTLLHCHPRGTDHLSVLCTSKAVLCTNLPCNPRRNARRNGNRRPYPRKRGTALWCHRILQRKDGNLRLITRK